MLELVVYYKKWGNIMDNEICDFLKIFQLNEMLIVTEKTCNRTRYRLYPKNIVKKNKNISNFNRKQPEKHNHLQRILCIMQKKLGISIYNTQKNCSFYS